MKKSKISRYLTAETPCEEHFDNDPIYNSWTKEWQTNCSRCGKHLHNNPPQKTVIYDVEGESYLSFIKNGTPTIKMSESLISDCFDVVFNFVVAIELGWAKMWVLNGKLHCEDGPAILWDNENTPNEYYLFGFPYASAEEFYASKDKILSSRSS